MSKLQSEIHQSRPFDSIQEELWLNLSRTTAAVSHQFEQKLRPHGLSPTQYNVLRILRGAGATGLMQHEVGERLVAQVPDVPRILSRMERAGWVQRVRSTDDRRVLRTTLAEKGLQLVNQLDEIIGGVHAGLFPAMSEEEMTNLSELLVLARRPRRDESA